MSAFGFGTPPALSTYPPPMSAMAAADRPFDEREQRYLLAEILKDSTIAPSDLLRLIQQNGIGVRWNEIALPYGRSVSACQKAFDRLVNPAAQIAAPYQPMPIWEQPQPTPKPKPKPRKKLPASSEAVSAVADLMAQAQPSPHFPPVNASSDLPPHQPSPIASTSDKLGKKRGRPNKAEYERRAAAAAERGEPYPPPKKIKTPRQSTEFSASAPVATPGMTQGDFVGEDSARKIEQEIPLTSAPPERNLALEATASAAEQMQADAERAVKSTVSDTQPLKTTAPSGLLAEMAEHAAQIEPEIVQSNTTLQQGSGSDRQVEQQAETTTAGD